MEKESSLIDRAVEFAARAHAGAVRKGNQMPYIVHPMEVMVLVSRLTDDPEVIAAAALHDVVEDTPCTLREIRDQFGERVARLVDYESEDKREGLPKSETWKIRKQESLDREANAPREAKMIMLADKLSNMRSTLKDYREDKDAIWQKFNMTDEREQEWYYKSVAELLEEFSDTDQYQEYISILDEIF